MIDDDDWWLMIDENDDNDENDENDENDNDNWKLKMIIENDNWKW